MFGRLLGWYSICIFGGCCPLMEFYQLLQNSLCVQVLSSPILAALLYGTRAAGISQTLWHGTRMELWNFCRGRYLYLAGRPSRWASAHILVLKCILVKHNLRERDGIRRNGIGGYGTGAGEKTRERDCKSSPVQNSTWHFRHWNCRKFVYDRAE